MIPSSINIHKKSAVLELIYDDQSYNLTAEYLRVFSPSADVKGHGSGQVALQHGKKMYSSKTSNLREITHSSSYFPIVMTQESTPGITCISLQQTIKSIGPTTSNALKMREKLETLSLSLFR